MRDSGHWQTEDYKQRMSIKEWKKILLEANDKVIFGGRLRQLKAKKLGYGILEIYKESLNIDKLKITSLERCEE